jgi:oligopeptidase B
MRLEAHGDVRVDEFFWLRERDNPEVFAYLEAENAYTEARTEHLAGLRDELFEEIRAHIQEDDDSPPAPDGPWEYFTRTITGAQYALHLRRPRGGGEEQIVLDENARAAGHDFFQAGDVEVSPDHRIVAWTEETTGGERYELRFREIAPARDLADVVANCYYGLAWASDGRTIFYTRPDGAMRPHQVWRHELGSPASDDVLVFEDPDERFDISLGRTRSGKWTVILSSSRITTEAWVVPAADPSTPAQCIEPRREGVEYSVDHHVHPATGDRFLVVTNDGGAENFELRAAPVETPGRTHWSIVVPHDDQSRLARVETFRDHLLLYDRVDGLERLRVLAVDTDELHTIELPDPVYSVWPGTNLEYDTEVIRYGYSSMVLPRSAYDYDARRRTSALVKRQPVPNYDPEQYTSARAWASADDGTRVPISIVRRCDTPLDGTAPLYHYAYGSYEATVEPVFRVFALPLVDRGFVVAISHPRGGGELGRRWWLDGRLECKGNTFTDFNACTRHLHATGHGAPSRTVARGGSAGGLLMGAITNLAPELYAGTILEVPFVDVISTMQDATIPLTVNEWDEWGNPEIESQYRAMRGYSPYDNLRAGVRYPRLLVTAGLNDPRVQYWEPAKYVAKVRALSPETDVLLKIEMGAGHHGPSGRYDLWRDEAFLQAWILETVGLAGR